MGGQITSLNHTLDKNGSLYDPAGTESCNVQIQKIRIAMLITEIKYQIATTVKWKYSCAVLGLAACHVSQNCNEKMQVRPAGQAGYPISLVASLDTVPVKCCVPLHYLKREKREEKRKFYIYPDVTHTQTYVYIYIYLAYYSTCRPNNAYIWLNDIYMCVCVHCTYTYIFTYTL